VLAQDSVELVFSGTVTSVEHAGPTETVILDAERVWKGSVKQRTTIYRPIPMTSGNTEFPLIFERGKRYVVIAHRLSAAERKDLGVADSTDMFGTNMCGDGSRPFSIAGQDLGRIGPGRQPVDQRPSVRRPAITPPHKIKDVAPVYSPVVFWPRIQGTVIVQIKVDETGKVSQAEVLRSIPLLDQAVIDSIMKWEYLPGLIDGVPFPYLMIVTVKFPP
jgi:TonB family protein